MKKMISGFLAMTMVFTSDCAQAINYAAAFNKKYITQTYPSLSLPVSGSV